MPILFEQDYEALMGRLAVFTRNLIFWFIIFRTHSALAAIPDQEITFTVFIKAEFCRPAPVGCIEISENNIENHVLELKQWGANSIIGYFSWKTTVHGVPIEFELIANQYLTDPVILSGSIFVSGVHTYADVTMDLGQNTRSFTIEGADFKLPDGKIFTNISMVYLRVSKH